MASKTPGTPPNDPRADDPKADYDAKDVSTAPADETIDAEIVDTDGDGRPDTVVEGTGLENDAPRGDGTLVGDDTVIGASEVGGDDPHHGKPAKKGGIGFGAVLAALVLVALVAGYFLFAAGDDEDAVVAEDAEPGVVVTDAAPFPGNELDAERPIRGEAAPGARRAAIEADAANEDASPGDDAALTPVQRRALAAAAAARAAGGQNEAEDQGAEAMMRRPDAGEDGAGDDSAGDDADLSGFQDDVMGAVANARGRDAQDPQVGDDASSATERMAAMVGRGDATETDDADAASDGAQVQEANSAAELLRERRRAALEARAARGAAAPTTDDPARAAEPRAAEQGQDDDPNALADMTSPQPDPLPEGADDPNALSGDAVTGTDAQAGTDRPSAAELLRQRRRAQQDAQDADEPAAQQPDRSALERLAERRRAEREREREAGDAPQLVDPRPAVVAVPRGAPERDQEADAEAVRDAMQAREAEQEADLDQRFDQVRTGIRQDVLAEAEQVIERAIAETEREVSELRAALSEQEQRSDARIAQLQDRLEVLQNRDASSAQQGVVILALSSLGSEIDQGRPFTRQLEDVERLIPNARSLRALSPSAAAGIPTEQALRERFSAVARRAQSAARRAEAQGPFDKLWANITGLFSVRERGEPEGDTPSAVISRAEAALERGDLAGATQELDALEGEAAEAFAGWQQDAALRVDAQDRIESLERAVLAPSR